MNRLYRIVHTTRYRYSEPVSGAHNEARLVPRETPTQRCTARRMTITPTPTAYRERIDFFGNPTCYFAIQQAHDELSVTVTSRVSVDIDGRSAGTEPTGVSWNAVRDAIATDPRPAALDARQFVLESRMVRPSTALAAYAAPSFPPGRPLREAADDLMRRIHAEFAYEKGVTTVATPLDDVLASRRGVCQDFAHLGIGCLRAVGLPARYVSGYIETTPPPGKARLVGADASHAWLALWTPDAGWVDLDPTNDQLVRDQHVTLSWGRDFADVTPLKGVVFGTGTHALDVSVDVRRVGGNGAAAG
jgi:transglutaminase-like putative cysteine protease